MTYDFDDILITPADITDINSRSEVNPFYGNKLPLFAAPMDTVVNRYNIQNFLDSGIKVCLPREATITPHHYSLNEDVFYAYSLADFRAVFLGEVPIKEGVFYALIDVANGHMPAVRDAVVESKQIYGERLQLMVGNVANPFTYGILSNAGADYVRVGIGNGCFIDGTKISTINGKKRIEEVVAGELVFTHKRNYKEVVSTKRFEYTGELIKINDHLTCTPDHEFYVLSKKYLDIVTDENIDTLCEWVSATGLYDNPDYLLIETEDYEKSNTVQN